MTAADLAAPRLSEHLQRLLLVDGVLGLADEEVAALEGGVRPSERDARPERFRVRHDLARDGNGVARASLLQMDVRPAGQEAVRGMLGLEAADGLDPLQPGGDLA